MITTGIRTERCKGRKDSEFVALPHQEAIKKYFIKSPYRGLLLYHKLGSGKSCSSIGIAEEMLRRNMINHVYVCTPGALRKNYVYEYCRRCGDDDQTRLQTYYTFITFNTTIFESVQRLDFNDSLVIIDEAQNLINGVKNVSKNPLALYNQILNSNARVLLLSATVIFKQIIEWCLIGNLLKDNTFPNIIQDDGINYEIELTDKNVFSKDKMKGIVSYFAGHTVDFPETIHHPPIRVLMTFGQNALFEEQTALEEKITKMGPPTREEYVRNRKKAEDKLRLFVMCSQNILTRSVSNVYYKPLYEKINCEKEYLEDVAGMIIKKRPECEDKLDSEGGWISTENLSSGMLQYMSPKIIALILNIVKHWNAKHVVFSFFIGTSGILLIHNLLKRCGISSRIYSGNVSNQQREQIKEDFNNIENRYGRNIKVLLSTEAGCEGITLLEVQHLHMFETNINPNKARQCIGRAVRFKSHSNMPEEERKVEIWKYYAVPFVDPLQRTTRDNFLFRSIDNYYDYYLNNGYIESLKQLYGKECFVNVGIDERLDIKNAEYIDQYERFYNILKENSIEETGLI